MAKEELGLPVEYEADLLAIIDEEIAGGITFENDIEQCGEGFDRATALDYYRGIMRDLPADPDWSHAVSKDVAATIDYIMPGLMRVFAGAGQIVTYNPAKPGDERGAAQATDYVNNLWENELNGYQVLITWIKDALQVRNGIVKAYWDQTPEYEVQDETGLDETQLTFLLQDPEVELVAARPWQQIVTDPMSGQQVPIPVYDVRIRRATTNGRMKLDNVPPEDFGLSGDARSIETARMAWHRCPKTRSDLIAEGFPREAVEDIPSWTTEGNDGLVERDNNPMPHTAPTANWAMQKVDVYECYILYDSDGDGIAERRKIVACGPNGARKLLSNDPWPDDLPFADLTPKPVPHRWMGESIADEVMDIQRIKTAVLRSGLDNIYLVNRPQREVVESQIINPDEVMNPKIAGVIRVKQSGAIQNLDTAFIGDKALMWLNYQDGIVKQRTGANQATAALDATALDPQTATAEQIEHDSSYARIELIARNMAELGLKKLFAKMLRILVRNQDRPRAIRLRGDWVDMDPRAWNANMDATINVGLGTGSRERDLAMLGGIQKQQAQIVQELGPMNPVVPPSKYVQTLHKMVEAAGLRNPDQFFSNVTDQDFMQWQQQQGQKPDPKLQIEQGKLQATVQGNQAKAQLEVAKAHSQMQIAQQKTAADIGLKREKQAADVVLARHKADLDYAEGLRELQLEDQLKRMEIRQAGESPGEDELRRPN